MLINVNLIYLMVIKLENKQKTIRWKIIKFDTKEVIATGISAKQRDKIFHKYYKQGYTVLTGRYHENEKYPITYYIY